MAQKKYVSLSKLSIFLDNLKNIFAPKTHKHTTSDITNLQSILDGKAESSHSHDDRYYTETEIDDMEFITVGDIDTICNVTS